MNSLRASLDAASSIDKELEQIVEATYNRLQAGESIDVEALAAAHPQFAAQLRDLLPTVEALMHLGDLPDSPVELLVGGQGDGAAVPERKLGDFRLIRELGRGGMGTVFEAEQLSMGRRVALKVLPFAALVQDKALQRFRNEVRAAAALDHPHIVRVYSVGEERGVHYYAMQLVRGQSLAAWIHQLREQRDAAEPSAANPSVAAPPNPDPTFASSAPPLSTKRVEQARRSTTSATPRAAERLRAAAVLGIQAAEALQHAHDQGVLHRDIKPSNLMLDADGNLYVTDFGLARIEADAGLTLTGDLLGTLRYMPPEQALGKRVVVDHRADVYSLGATLYELLTLEPAFDESDRTVLLRQIAVDEPRPVRKLDRRIPPELETIVHKAMGKTPEERYQSAQLLADDLQAFVDHRPIKARPASLQDRVRKWSRRHQSFVGVAVLALAVLSAVLAVSTVVVNRAQRQTLAALEETSALLYVADISAAYQSLEKGWTDEAQAILNRYRPAANEPDRSELEWRLLQCQLQEPESITLAGHEGPVTELAVFPDRRRLASVGADGTLRIWDVTQRRLVQEIRVCDRALTAVAVSPNGRWVVVGSGILSPDGTAATVGSGDVSPDGNDETIEPDAVYLCDLDDGGRLKELFRGKASIESIAFAGDGKHFVAGSRYEDVCLSSLDGQIVKRIPCASRVESLEYLAGGQSLLVPNRVAVPVGRPMGIAQIWSNGLAAVEREFQLTRQSGSVNYTILRSSPDGRRIAAGDRYKARTFLLDADSGRVLAETPASRDRINDVAYAPDGGSIAVGYRNGRVEYFLIQQDAVREASIDGWPLVINAHDGETTSVRFLTPDILATSGADGLVRIWYRPSNGGATYQVTDATLVGAKVSPDGDLALCTCHQEYVLVDVKDGNVLFRRTVPDEGFGMPVWSPRGDRAALCCENAESVVILDRRGRVICTIPHPGGAEAVAFSPDGALLAHVGRQVVQICHAGNGQIVFQRDLGAIGLTVGFSPDGRRLAVGRQGGTIALLDVAARKLVSELSCGSDATALDFSPDGARLATGHGDSVIRLWKLADAAPPAELPGHARQVSDVEFSADGRTLVSSAEDGAIRVWSVDPARGFGVVSQRGAPNSYDAKCCISLSRDDRLMIIGFTRRSGEGPDLAVWRLDETRKD